MKKTYVKRGLVKRKNKLDREVREIDRAGERE
jgi:hypothetical protein